VSAPIQYIVEWQIPPANLARFKDLAAEATRLVAQNEPAMLGYHWYLNADGTQCTLLEWYPEASHLAVHRANLAELLPQMLAIATMQLRVFGGLDESAQGGLADRGVEYREHFVGTSRVPNE
jgi:quinol monooxygenase YgiN